MIFYERLACFLSQFAELENGDPIPEDPLYIRDAINLLLTEGIPKEKIRQEALIQYGVYIPDDYFMEVRSEQL